MFRTSTVTNTRPPLAVRAFAAAAITVGSLALTACADGTGTRDEGAATFTAQAAAKHSTESQPATNRRTARGKDPVTCTGSAVEVRVTEVARPVNHLLITATNTGPRSCSAYGAPYLRFDDAQAPADTGTGSVPQAVVTLKPGQSAYAGVMTSAADGSGAHGRTAHRLGVRFAGRSTHGSVGKEVSVELPAGGVHVDSTATTTYWQTTPEAALAG
ncbi:DUF4232 domain-containing protein [Streptomyces sp. NPDC046465]|uniref:DUF4232 domain-containing protein n=1 Tax=Streptomyces sp. NPDC046465 TaxID=3155810 RepID=UPI0033FE8181